MESLNIEPVSSVGSTKSSSQQMAMHDKIFAVETAGHGQQSASNKPDKSVGYIMVFKTVNEVVEMFLVPIQEC